MSESNVPEKLVNPITGLPVDEVIKRAEANERGYLTLEYMMKHLEDENESLKYFVVDGKKIIVEMGSPTTQYKKKPTLDYERVLATTYDGGEVRKNTPTPVACTLDDPTCEACGS